jgi:hypothetical protein
MVGTVKRRLGDSRRLSLDKLFWPEACAPDKYIHSKHGPSSQIIPLHAREDLSYFYTDRDIFALEFSTYAL